MMLPLLPLARRLTGLLLLLALLLAGRAARAQSVGIGTTTPNAAAALDITASGKGLLVPRMDSATRAAIAAPPTGLLVFQTDGRQGFWYYGGGAWLWLPDKAKGGDNLGNHQATQNLALNNHLLINTPAATTGLRLSDNGFARLGAPANYGVSTSNRFDVFDNNSGTFGGQAMSISAYGGSASPNPIFKTYSLRGTATAMQPVQRADAIGSLYFYGLLGSSSLYPMSGIDASYLGDGQTSHPYSNLGFLTSFSYQMLLDSVGRLGVGTLQPAYRLDVNGTIHATTPQGVVLDAQDRPLITRGWDAFTSGNYQGLGRWGVFMEPFNLTFGVPTLTGRNFAWATYNLDSSVGSQLMNLSQTGFLGLGTNGTPGVRLDLVSDNLGGGPADDVLLRSYGVGGSPGIGQRRYRGSRAAPANLQAGDFLGEFGLSGYINGAENAFTLSGLSGVYKGDGTTPLTDLRLLSSGVERVRVDEAGNVGVGLTAPTARLEVQGSGAGLGIGRVRVRSTNDQAGIGFVAATSGGVPSTEAVVYQPQASSDLRLYVGNADRLSVTSAGQVGIGTSTPNYLLDVAGSENYTGTLYHQSLRILGYAPTPGGSYALSNLFVGNAHVPSPTPSGDYNTFVGDFNAPQLSSGRFNSGLGVSAGLALTTGERNTLIGCAVGNKLQDGSNNTAIGQATLLNAVSSSYNTALGSFNGNSVTTGSYNTFVGYNADLASSATQHSNATAIGYNAKVDQDNALVLGNSAVSVGIGTSTPAAKLDVNGTVRLGTSTGPGKVTTPTTGTANLLAVAYGQLGSSPVATYSTSGNYTATRTGTGTYTLTFSAASGLSGYNFDNAPVTVSLYASAGFITWSGDNGKIYVNTYNPSGSAADRVFTFTAFAP